MDTRRDGRNFVRMNCKICNGEMKPGKAIEQTYTGIPDFIGGDVVTISPGGPGRLIDCLKCVKCGWSVYNEKRNSLDGY